MLSGGDTSSEEKQGSRRRDQVDGSAILDWIVIGGILIAMTL
jgi:hypothetical protein